LISFHQDFLDFPENQTGENARIIHAIIKIMWVSGDTIKNPEQLISQYQNKDILLVNEIPEIKYNMPNKHLPRPMKSVAGDLGIGCFCEYA
jgi:hypothetical protein